MKKSANKSRTSNKTGSQTAGAPAQRRGRIVILSGPSGSGKTTLHRLLLRHPAVRGRLVKSVSVTTRPPRPGERCGRDYIFVSPRMFAYKKRAGHFLESACVFGHSYGTPKKNVEALLKQGRNVLLCIDVQGARLVKQRYPDAIMIFIKPPSLKELRQRLNQRGTETREEQLKRLHTAKEEMLWARDYDHVLINRDLKQSLEKLIKILRQEGVLPSS